MCILSPTTSRGARARVPPGQRAAKLATASQGGCTREDPASGTKAPGLLSSKMEVLSLHQLLGKSPALEQSDNLCLGHGAQSDTREHSPLPLWALRLRLGDTRRKTSSGQLSWSESDGRGTAWTVQGEEGAAKLSGPPKSPAPCRDQASSLTPRAEDTQLSPQLSLGTWILRCLQPDPSWNRSRGQEALSGLRLGKGSSEL